MMRLKWLYLLLMGCSASAGLQAAEASDTTRNAGFLEDYTILRPGPGGISCYKAENFQQQIRTYDAVMIDQPEVFISPESTFRGLKVRQLDIMTSAFRTAVQGAMAANYRITDTPGPGVMLIRLAAVDMLLKKQRFHILEYTPVGLVVGTSKYVFESQLNRAMRHIDLTDVKIEGELRDSQSGALLGEFVGATREGKHPEKWHHLLKTLDGWARQFDANMQLLHEGGSRAENCR